MNPQHDLPAARVSDPTTSLQASDAITASGERAHQRANTIAAVRAFPGRTSQELADLSGHDRYMLARRLSECERAKLVRRGVARICDVTGHQALTWYPTEAATEPT